MKKKNIGLIAGIVLLVVLCVVYFVLHNHNANSSEEDSTDTATTAFETDTDKLTEPEGTYLLWLDFKSLGMKEEQLKDLVENKAKLWLDSGAMFGPDGEGFERINIACPREILKQALTQLAESVHDR